MKKFLFIAVVLLADAAFAGILPTSRGGTGANITPLNGDYVKSTSSGFAVTNSIVVPSGGTVYVSAGTTLVAPFYWQTSGSTLTTPVKGAFETNGADLYWTDSTGTRYKLNKTQSN